MGEYENNSPVKEVESNAITHGQHSHSAPPPDYARNLTTNTDHQFYTFSSCSRLDLIPSLGEVL